MWNTRFLKKIERWIKMALFPLGFNEINLWLAFTAIILLITSELVSQAYGKTNFYLDRKRLRRTGIVVSVVFLLSLALRIIGLVVYQ